MPVVEGNSVLCRKFEAIWDCGMRASPCPPKKCIKLFCLTPINAFSFCIIFEYCYELSFPHFLKPICWNPNLQYGGVRGWDGLCNVIETWGLFLMNMSNVLYKVWLPDSFLHAKKEENYSEKLQTGPHFITWSLSTILPLSRTTGYKFLHLLIYIVYYIFL